MDTADRQPIVAVATSSTAAGQRSARLAWRVLSRSARSIRTRIVAGYAVLAAVALVLSVVAMRQLLDARVDRDTNTMMATSAAELRQLAAVEDPASGQPYGTDVRALLLRFLETKVPQSDQYFVAYLDGTIFRSSTGSPISARVNATALGATPSAPEAWRGRVHIDGRRVEVATVPLSNEGVNVGALAILRVPAAAHADVDRAVRTLGFVGIGVWLLGLLGAWALTGRIVRPIRELTAMARATNDRDLSARIPVSGNDELSELGWRFNEMLDRIERGATQQRHFVDDVAHELRTPITIIRGHLDVTGDDPAERAEIRAIVDDELGRMERYVNDLLLLARSELPDFVQPKTVDVGALIGAVHSRVLALGERRWVVDEVPPPGTLTVQADQGRLMQAMANLATNAVQHTVNGADIGIGARAVPGAVELWVRDSGPGVDPVIRDTLFDRAHRGPSSRARRPDGTGIGLSIVAAVAEAHGGSARVDPGVPVGARFVITVPRPERALP